MTDREEHLEQALLRIQQWANAYPVTVFIPLGHDDVKRAAQLLEANGISFAGLHGGWARHILGTIGEICESALKEE